jgi:adenine deaminase
VALVRGFGLTRGALASTICHDAHNLIVVGTNDDDMLAAAEALVAEGGGLASACDGKITALLPLPIAGLMSDLHADRVAEAYARVCRAALKLGSTLPDPFLSMSFLGLSVIPELRLTDRGLLRVGMGRLVSLEL